jgi:hypothetical protein
MRWSALPLLAVASLAAVMGCATASPRDLSSAYPEVAPAPVEAPAPATDLPEAVPAALPEVGGCDAAPELDPRCPADILAAAALSWLDKTVAEFDGTTMRVIEYDRDALLGEAFADAGFRRLVQLADAAPADGVLDHAEARDLEGAVLRLCEARMARFNRGL